MTGRAVPTPETETSESPKRGPGIGRSTLINLLGLLVPTVVGLATVPLYLHQIGEIRYGVLLLAFTFLGYFGAILLYFLGQWLFAAIFRIPAELRPEMENAVPWLAAIVPLTAVISVLAGALEARQSFPPSISAR